MRKIKGISLILLFILSIFFVFVSRSVKADEVPVLPASEVVANNVSDAIVSETNISEFNFNSFMISDRVWVANTSGNAGRWIYRYTIDPYSYYQHSGSGQWRMLQTTSTVNHTVNTIVNGVATNSSSWPIPYYNPEFAHLLGG